MKYAVVRIGGNQYKVKEEDELVVDRLPQKEGEEFELVDVLLVVNDGKVDVGQPILEGISLKVKIISHLKGEKIRIFRYRAKSRYRKTKGFRPALTKIKVLEIGVRTKVPNGKKEPQKIRKDNI